MLTESEQNITDGEQQRERLIRLSDACLRINASLDLNTTLQSIIDGARSLTDARYGALLLFDDRGGVQDFVTSGISSVQRKRVGSWPEATGLLGHLRKLQEPVRLRDLGNHPMSAGFPKNHPQMKTFLGMPICHQGEALGSIYLTEKTDANEFTPDDEDIIVTFASQAALAISNAFKYKAERRAKLDFQALLDSSPIGVLVLDAKTGGISSMNDETRRMVGSTGVGISLEQLLSEMTIRRADGREFCLAELPLERVLGSGESVRSEEIVIRLPDGRSITTLVNARPIYSEAGEIVSVVAAFQDITSLQESKLLREELLGMVNSELRTPLTTIKGSTESVLGSLSPLDPAETRQFFRIIDEQTNYMRDLIRNLLDATRIEAGTFSINREPTDVSSMVFEARGTFQGSGVENRVTIDLQPNLPPVLADRHRILQVMSNLLSNASKNSPEATTIGVTASHVDGHVEVTVAHEAVSAVHLPASFDAVPWINREESECEREGSGLALRICKWIVEAHGGHITALKEAPESGVRVTFTIPVAGEDAGAAAAASLQVPERSEQVSVEKERILVIDDDSQTVHYLQSALSRGGYAPIATSNLEEVSSLLYEVKPSLVLLDLVLAGSNRFEIVKSISQYTDAPIIFLSGYGRERTIVEAFELGAADYIVKPFSSTELLTRITTALRRKKVSERTQSLAPFVLGDLEINYAERRVSFAGRPIRLTATEYNLLFELSINAGRVLTHEQLLDRVWGAKGSRDSQVLRAFIKVLRRKLGDDARNPVYILTDHRVGYRMAKPEPDVAETAEINAGS